MKCSQCGAELKPGVRFCTRCGAPVSPLPAGRGRSLWWPVGLGVLGVGLLALACVIGGVVLYVVVGKPGTAMPVPGIAGTPALVETPVPTMAPTVAATTVPQPTLTATAPATPVPPTPTLVPTDTPIPPTPTPVVVEYDVGEAVTLVNDGPGIATRILLWVALLRDIEPYQEVISMEITPQDFETITDEYGNLYAKFEFTDVAPGGKVDIEIRYQVAVNELDFDLGDCEGPLPGIFVDPEPRIESDAEQIIALAEELAEGQVTACERVEAFYNYVGDSVSYAGYDPGDKGALSTLEDLAGDCTDFVDLLLALSRAANIPARFIEGVTCCTNGDYVESEIKHDWLEIYLPGTGWAPMDPTWGRFPVDRETYFAGITPDHIVVTQGRNLPTLEGGHYYFYRWWWGAESTEVSAEEEWRIVRLGE